MAPIAIGLHGGCGTLDRSLLSDAEWTEAASIWPFAARGLALLAAGGSALDAVEAAVVVMEDSPHFNAGYGAALNEAGEHELDASIMDGASLAAGAVCAVRRIRNPVTAARAVLERAELSCWPAPPLTTLPPRGLAMVQPVLHDAASGRRARLLKARVAAGTCGAPAKPRNMARSAQSHGIGTVIWPPPRRRAASTTSPSAGSGTVPSSAQGPTRETASARSPAPDKVKSSSDVSPPTILPLG